MITLKKSRIVVMVLVLLVLISFTATNGLSSRDERPASKISAFEPYQFIIFGDTRNSPEGIFSSFYIQEMQLTAVLIKMNGMTIFGLKWKI
ncbi:MAG: hypothetical protein ACTSP4_17380 [Candidatus Hodarchaeales archaeon]